MIRIIDLLFLMALAAHAQSLANTKTFWGVGVSALAESSPKPTGWAAIAVPINTKYAIYSISETDYSTAGLHPIKVQTSVRTGFATLVKQLGPVAIYGLANAGTATTGANTGGAFAGGGVALVPLSKSKTTLILGIRIIKTSIGGTTQLIEVGFGRVGAP